MRRTKRYTLKGGANPLFHIYQTVSFWKTFKNTAVIEVSRFVPFVRVKNALYRRLLGMKIGAGTAFAYKVVPDIMFPEQITVGRNTIIGYNTTILAHEYLTTEYRIGPVVIGDNVMIGANCTILPGIEIGDGAIVSAMTLVNKDVPPGAFAGGNPMIIKPASAKG
ncbi:acyltransferase [Domibacillus sp. DTU_2020_1001157_1_SI_ALB_TIR_016]|uniref:acyltransferase n=1 Tax=Domibacillus sp. DTU_2020_1001157_1_SI_ALB_TIR_016 TaxID=3077789 RepID=UPI0028EEC929|nr:acyltransferase [Domibacillus sp. DTU_2020_1001157_1_SI_ALB_TIR_016]WNS81353.1 acyltransferase [Domibacillus sp. DTU_2020_1001157_1_SI_ALB_TIR_016]